MANVNKVTVMGVLGRDPKTKQFPNGGSITTFSIATSEFCKDKTGYRVAQNHHQQPISRDCRKYLKKSGKVYIEGLLRTRKWKDQSRSDREVTEIRADVLQLL